MSPLESLFVSTLSMHVLLQEDDEVDCDTFYAYLGPKPEVRLCTSSACLVLAETAAISLLPQCVRPAHAAMLTVLQVLTCYASCRPRGGTTSRRCCPARWTSSCWRTASGALWPSPPLRLATRGRSRMRRAAAGSRCACPPPAVIG